MHGLPVGGDDDHEHPDHRQSDPRRQGGSRHAGHSQGDKDLVRGVADRGQGVGGKDRKSDPLRKESLAQRLVGNRATDEEPLEAVSEVTHEASAYD